MIIYLIKSLLLNCCYDWSVRLWYPVDVAHLCIGTCAGRERALHWSSLCGDTDRERCCMATCLSGTVSVLDLSLSLEFLSAALIQVHSVSWTCSSQKNTGTFESDNNTPTFTFLKLLQQFMPRDCAEVQAQMLLLYTC